MISCYKGTLLCRFIVIGLTSLLMGKLSAQQTTADTLSLTLQQAEQQFLQQNLTLLAGHFNVRASEALIEQAGLRDNPVLTTDQNIYSKGNGFFTHGKNDNGDYKGQIYVQVQQLLKTAGKRSKAINLATTTSEIAALQLLDVTRSLKYQLRTDYFTVGQLLGNRTVLEQELVEMNHLLTGMAAQLKAGNIAQKDYLRIQALSISLQQDIAENTRSLADIETELKTFLRITSNTFIKPADGLELDITATPSLDSAIALAKRNNTAYMLQQKQVVYQQQNLVYQKALRSPDITVGPEFDQASSYAPNYVGVTISLPLPIRNKNQGNIKAATFNIQQEQTNLQQIETALTNNVTNAYNKLLLSQEYKTNVQNEFYSQYKTLFNNVLQSYKQRQISLLEFIDFFDAYKETNSRLLQQQFNLQKAKEELNFQTGTDVIR
jgi:outer membrane protein, heavy metal efflux system